MGTQLEASVIGFANARFYGAVGMTNFLDSDCLAALGTRLDELSERRLNSDALIGDVEVYVESPGSTERRLVTYKFTGTKRVVDEPWVRASDGTWYFADCDRVEEDLLEQG